MQLYPFQEEALKKCEDRNRVAFYHDMGLGKTFTGGEKLHQLGESVNLVVCQKSKIDDWIDHFEDHYPDTLVFNLTYKKELEEFWTWELEPGETKIGIINYDLLWRREELRKLRDFTLLLDESSLIQNETSKRSKFILKKLHMKNVILLSGTPTGGKYENLWSQLHLLGWDISKKDYWNRYIRYKVDMKQGFPLKIVYGYKNVDELKAKMREHGADFLKADDVLDLPDKVFQTVNVPTIPAYWEFTENRIVTIDGVKYKGDTAFNYRLYRRMLCGYLNPNRRKALETILESCDDRLIVFYNFNEELQIIKDVCKSGKRPLSVVNGEGRDLDAYESESDSVTAIQYQAGSMGLNLQKSNKIVYFTLPDGRSEEFEQSQKRTHRIGQKQTCFYYILRCPNTIDDEISVNLNLRKYHTDNLFLE